jgi:hypothetical protein
MSVSALYQLKSENDTEVEDELTRGVCYLKSLAKHLRFGRFLGSGGREPNLFVFLTSHSAEEAEGDQGQNINSVKEKLRIGEGCSLP